MDDYLNAAPDTDSANLRPDLVLLSLWISSDLIIFCLWTEKVLIVTWTSS